MSHEGETCEGCVWWCQLADTCRNEEAKAIKIGWSVGAPPCPCFIPSLECRKVRAQELLAKCVVDVDGDGHSLMVDGWVKAVR